MIDITMKVRVNQSDLRVELRGRGIIGLLGPNGSGKTRALRCIAGLLECKDSHILLNGVDVSGQPAGKRGIVYVSPNSYFQELTVYDHFDTLLKNKVTAYEELGSLKEALGIDYSGKMKFKSTGQRVRVAVAVAVLSHASLVLLDEVPAVISEPEKFIMSLMGISSSRGTDFLIATNQANLAVLMNAAYEIADGQTRELRNVH
ncbi:ATP-binding cassette domain-containing protein [Thermoplasmatales archaeon AK]|nr:ATP-binding cassette domain-containing protein [Thermoplasmatales archaeon AK]